MPPACFLLGSLAKQIPTYLYSRGRLGFRESLDALLDRDRADTRTSERRLAGYLLVS